MDKLLVLFKESGPMKIQKVSMIVASMVTGAIALPFALPLQNNIEQVQVTGTLASIVLFLASYIFTISMGWVKRVQK